MKKGLHKSLLPAVGITVLTLISNVTVAQLRYEIGINLGPSNFIGDLGGNEGRGKGFLKDNNFEMTRLMKGINVKIIPNDYIHFRVGMNIGRLEGADSVINPKGGLEEARYYRNQHFRSPLLEAYAAAEVYPLVLLEDDPDDLVRKIRPYALIGVGVFTFNPQAQYTNPNGQKEWVDLQPLRTEGQGMAKHPNRKEYSLTQVNIPMGIGIRYYFNDRFNLSFELVNRMTFTDYIDDVSTTYIATQDFYDFFGNTPQADQAAQVANMSNLLNGGLNRPGYEAGDKRGTPTNNDSYYSTTFKLGYIFGGNRGNNAEKQTRCPVIRF